MNTTDPHAVVLQLYRLLSAPLDAIAARAALGALFLPDARVRGVMTSDAGIEDVGNWTVSEYLDMFAVTSQAQHAAGLRTERSELWQQTYRYANVAQVFSTFEARSGSGGDVQRARGVYAIQLLRVAGEWRIAGLAAHIERKREPIPTEELPPRAVAPAA